MTRKRTEEEILKEMERLKQVIKQQNALLGLSIIELEPDGNGTIVVYTNDERVMRSWVSK